MTAVWKACCRRKPSSSDGQREEDKSSSSHDVEEDKSSTDSNIADLIPPMTPPYECHRKPYLYDPGPATSNKKSSDARLRPNRQRDQRSAANAFNEAMQESSKTTPAPAGKKSTKKVENAVSNGVESYMTRRGGAAGHSGLTIPDRNSPQLANASATSSSAGADKEGNKMAPDVSCNDQSSVQNGSAIFSSIKTQSSLSKQTYQSIGDASFPRISSISSEATDHRRTLSITTYQSVGDNSSPYESVIDSTATYDVIVHTSDRPNPTPSGETHWTSSQNVDGDSTIMPATVHNSAINGTENTSKNSTEYEDSIPTCRYSPNNSYQSLQKKDQGEVPNVYEFVSFIPKAHTICSSNPVTCREPRSEQAAEIHRSDEKKAMTFTGRCMPFVSAAIQID